MPTLLVAAPAPLSGKTTLVVALSRALRKSGQSAALERSGDDDHAAADRQTLAALSGTGDKRIVELPSGQVSHPSHLGAKVLVIATPRTAGEAAEMAKAAGDALAGVVLNMAPVKGEKSAPEGIAPIAVIPEDRTLGAPDLAAVAAALDAETENFDEHTRVPLDVPVIASIAADPGQAYFDRTRASTVIVRSDKPDLQLAALNAGAECFIITGGMELLIYVRNRIAEDELPVLRTALDTESAVGAIGRLYGQTPFQMSDERATRADDLFAALNVNELFS